jgi:adenosine deaminase
MTERAMIEQSEPRTAAGAELERRFAAMPKAEIHVHLEGATAPDASYAIAKRNHVDLPVASLDEWRRYFEFRDFPHFIDVYRKTTDTIRTTDDLALMIAQFYVDQARQNIRYTECFMSMSLHLRRLKPGEILDALAQGIERGRTVSEAQIRFIADIAREDVELQGDVLDLALHGRKRGLIIGLGLGGLEREFPPHLFIETYKKAAAAGLHVVAHAGEAAGVESIRGAVEELNVARIGHGIRIVDSPEYAAVCRAKDIAFEVCPVSNYAIGSTPIDKPHPIRQMVDLGLRVTVNTDDPAMFSTNLAAQYQLLADQGFSWDELWKLNTATLDATFLSDAEKATYKREWDDFAASLG